MTATVLFHGISMFFQQCHNTTMVKNYITMDPAKKTTTKKNMLLQWYTSKKNKTKHGITMLKNQTNVLKTWLPWCQVTMSKIPWKHHSTMFKKIYHWVTQTPYYSMPVWPVVSLQTAHVGHAGTEGGFDLDWRFIRSHCTLRPRSTVTLHYCFFSCRFCV